MQKYFEGKKVVCFISRADATDLDPADRGQHVRQHVDNGEEVVVGIPEHVDAGVRNRIEDPVQRAEDKDDERELAAQVQYGLAGFVQADRGEQVVDEAKRESGLGFVEGSGEPGDQSFRRDLQAD